MSENKRYQILFRITRRPLTHSGGMCFGIGCGGDDRRRRTDQDMQVRTWKDYCHVDTLSII